MKGYIRVSEYGRNAMLQAKGEMRYSEIRAVLMEKEREAMELIREGWEHVLFGMGKYRSDGQMTGIDLMMIPMHEEQFEFVAKRCRNAIVYALHRR